MPPFLERGAPACEGDLLRLERELGEPLPVSYRSFLLAGDGASLDGLNRIDGAEQLSIAEIYAIRTDFEEYEVAHNRRVYARRVPGEFLVIGEDLAGNCWCLGIQSPHTGDVYWWDHEREAEEGQEPTLDNMTYVADDFLDLIDRIQPLEN